MQKGKYASRCFFLFPISIERMNNWLSNTKRITFWKKTHLQEIQNFFLCVVESKAAFETHFLEGCLKKATTVF
jgi:hypothetical protein